MVEYRSFFRKCRQDKLALQRRQGDIYSALKRHGGVYEPKQHAFILKRADLRRESRLLDIAGMYRGVTMPSVEIDIRKIDRVSQRVEERVHARYPIGIQYHHGVETTTIDTEPEGSVLPPCENEECRPLGL